MDKIMSNKILKFVFVDEINSTAFFDENNNVLGVIHENDANWQNEYFKPIIEKLGIKVVKVEESELPKMIEKIKDFGYY